MKKTRFITKKHKSGELAKKSKFTRRQAKVSSASDEQIGDRVTNKTLDYHRSEVISRGKRLKYPFHHSKYKVVILSVGILVITIVVFFTIAYVRLYKNSVHGNFDYGLTGIIPAPVARVDGKYVNYHDYLFELRSMTYFPSQVQNIDLSTTDGQKMLATYRRIALDRAEQFTYAKSVVASNNQTVTHDEITQKVADIMNKSLESGDDSKNSDKNNIFLRSIKQNYNWSENDLRKSIEMQLYQQKAKDILNTEASSKALEALNKLRSGDSFAKVAKQMSDDSATRNKAGVVGTITSDGVVANDGKKAKLNLPTMVIEELFKLHQNDISDVIKADDALYIVKNAKTEGKTRKLAYIKINLQDMSVYMEELRSDNKIQEYIDVPRIQSGKNNSL